MYLKNTSSNAQNENTNGRPTNRKLPSQNQSKHQWKRQWLQAINMLPTSINMMLQLRSIANRNTTTPCSRRNRSSQSTNRKRLTQRVVTFQVHQKSSNLRSDRSVHAQSRSTGCEVQQKSSMIHQNHRAFCIFSAECRFSLKSLLQENQRWFADSRYGNFDSGWLPSQRLPSSRHVRFRIVAIQRAMHPTSGFES